LINVKDGQKADEVNEKISKACSTKLKLACFDMDWKLIRKIQSTTLKLQKEPSKLS
jgi:hypothetical protein